MHTITTRNFNFGIRILFQFANNFAAAANQRAVELFWHEELLPVLASLSAPNRRFQCIVNRTLIFLGMFFMLYLKEKILKKRLFSYELNKFCKIQNCEKNYFLKNFKKHIDRNEINTPIQLWLPLHSHHHHLQQTENNEKIIFIIKKKFY